jgi:2-polyprenyl-3-methyl-5-hydroxy-6-metoxy-1,4-benzoquinol methylase
MIDHDNLEDFGDPQIYDLQDEGYADDNPLTEQWARATGGPLLDLACGTGRMALRMAKLGYQVTGVDITPEMIAWARQKAAKQNLSIEWVVADARTFHLGKQFPFIYMLENVFQFFLTRADQEAMLARVREHLLPQGCLLFETRNPSPRPRSSTTPAISRFCIQEVKARRGGFAQHCATSFPRRWRPCSSAMGLRSARVMAIGIKSL